ncbi:26S proteasome subunit RPN7-domain-containing protein [Dactylonectria macrodidyma]|uniref:COP9 signalosome complex subunit 1 n=1 Tax=Dactylonectria macrodidyma TaxID=307937 RepID=A0A9P9EJF5_9HYPO|nr:26S proteasome subunit RPN7-domain-containing protein [Dactylonectria macrodidyma]
MADSSSLLEFFTQMNNMNGVIVKDQPKLDLDLYLQNYTGRTRYDRLILIGKCSVSLCVDALKAAVAEAKAGSDVSRYREAWDCIRLAAPNEPEAQRDDAWIENTDRTNKLETARLELELKGYKNNLIKESIRMGNEDLGRHFESIGFLNEAAEYYSKMRQDVSTTKHIIDCGMRLVNISLQRRDWTMVLNNLGKITGVPNGEEEKATQAYTKIVSGIALLGLGHYSDAAKSFLQTDFGLPSVTYSHVASPNDVAIYGGLLALATMDRKELQTRVLENQSFRTFLEHEPHIRKAISLFVNGRYSNCLSILESVRNDYMLDIYLQRHIPAIYAQIRSKSIVQYFVPFSCVTLDTLNEAFAREGESLEEELVEMIREGTLKARMDAKNKLLLAVVPDPRLEMQQKALEAARQYEQEAKERLRRMSLVAAGLEVAGFKKSHGPKGGIEETWYDDIKPLPSGVEALE